MCKGDCHGHLHDTVDTFNVFLRNLEIRIEKDNATTVTYEELEYNDILETNIKSHLFPATLIKRILNSCKKKKKKISRIFIAQVKLNLF